MVYFTDGLSDTYVYTRSAKSDKDILIAYELTDRANIDGFSIAGLDNSTTVDFYASNSIKNLFSTQVAISYSFLRLLRRYASRNDRVIFFNCYVTIKMFDINLVIKYNIYDWGVVPQNHISEVEYCAITLYR